MYAKAQCLLLKDSYYGEECLDRVWQEQRQEEQIEVAAIVWAKDGGWNYNRSGEDGEN